MSTKPEQSADGSGSRFKIGAVSRITQIPVDTLRAWERRYQVVSPQRAGTSARLYDEEDVARLKLIRRLVAAGHAISSIANLARGELEEMSELHQPAAAGSHPAAGAVATAVVLSETRASLSLGPGAGGDAIEVLAHCRSWSELDGAVMRTSPDALVLEVGALLPEQGHEIIRLRSSAGTRRTIVIYGFASAHTLEHLGRNGVVTLRAPLDLRALERELGRPVAASPVADADEPAAAVPRLFDNATLENLAELTPAVQCECPHHLVDLVRALLQFEAYSAACENKDDEDAALHSRLRIKTSVARNVIEQTLVEVAEYEGITLPESIIAAARERT